MTSLDENDMFAWRGKDVTLTVTEFLILNLLRNSWT